MTTPDYCVICKQPIPKGEYCFSNVVPPGIPETHYHVSCFNDHLNDRRAKHMSKIKYIEGDLFEALKKLDYADNVFVPHVCNSQGAWGSGFVVPLGNVYPAARDCYLNWCGYGSTKAWHLDNDSVPFEIGQTQLVIASNDPGIIIANMVAQHMGGIRPLMYNHLVTCMDYVANMAVKLEASIMCPMFGSMRAGGNWDFIAELIEDCWLDREIDVSIFYLPGQTPKGWTPPKE